MFYTIREQSIFLTFTIFNPIIYTVFDNDQKIKIIFSSYNVTNPLLMFINRQEAFEFLQERRTIMSEIKQNITNELSEEELENVAGGFGRPTMDDPRYREQMRINNMLKRGMNMEEIQKALKSYS